MMMLMSIPFKFLQLQVDHRFDASVSQFLGFTWNTLSWVTKTLSHWQAAGIRFSSWPQVVKTELSVLWRTRNQIRSIDQRQLFYHHSHNHR